MSSPHLSTAALERYLAGDADAAEATAVEAHVETCAECAAQLQREARFEMALSEVAAAPRVIERPRSRRAALVAVGGVLALAAGAAVIVAPSTPSSAHAPRVVACDEPSTHEACMKNAHFDGLLTRGPGRHLEIPRYDLQPGEEKP